jgi:hypothetical protein
MFVLSQTPWRDKEWFISQFIYESINELSKEWGLDWSSVDRWRQIHGFPNHSEKIFDAICFYSSQVNQLNTMSVITQMHIFHKQHHDKIYKCLCPSCHQHFISKITLLLETGEKTNFFIS